MLTDTSSRHWTAYTCKTHLRIISYSYNTNTECQSDHPLQLTSRVDHIVTAATHHRMFENVDSTSPTIVSRHGGRCDVEL